MVANIVRRHGFTCCRGDVFRRYEAAMNAVQVKMSMKTRLQRMRRRLRVLTMVSLCPLLQCHTISETLTPL